MQSTHRFTARLAVACLAAAFSCSSAIAAQATIVTTEEGTAFTIPSSAFTPTLRNNLQADGAKVQTIEVVSGTTQASGPVCGGMVGGQPQPECEDQAATFEGSATRDCPAGSFFDLTKFACYTCPTGYSRNNLFGVEADRACRKQSTSTAPRYEPAGFQGQVCAAGSFFAPILGQCWSCPSGYSRTANLLKGPKACKRSAGVFKPASFVSNASCEAGEFKDPVIEGGILKPKTGGGCWTCPDSYFRTVTKPVSGPQACYTNVNYVFSSAEKTADGACPSGQVFDFIGLTSADISKRRLSGVSPVSSGTCWSCPTGYRRKFNSVKADNACGTRQMGWYSAPYNNPGLFGLAGAKDVLLDAVKTDPVFVRKAIDEVAKKAQSAGAPGSLAQIKAREVSLLTSAPEQSPVAAGIVFTRLLAALSLDASKRTPAETQLITAFSDLVKARRTHVAKDALAAYDAWKARSDYEISQRPAGSLFALFDYGPVPPDYEDLAVASALGLGGLDTAIGIATGSLPLVGEVLSVALSAATSFGSFSDAESAARFAADTAAGLAIGAAVGVALEQFAAASASAALANQAATVHAIKAIADVTRTASQTAANTTSVAASAGPQVIIAVAFIVGQIALEQALDAANARPNILKSITMAGRNPDLPRLAQTGEGIGEMMGHWAFAISKPAAPPSSWKSQYTSIAQAAVSGTATTSASAASDPNAMLSALTLHNGNTYFFYPNGTYSRYSNGATQIARGYPTRMPGGWRLTGNFSSKGPTAAFPYGTSTKSYMFRDSTYIRLTTAAMDRGYPKAMPGGWRGLPSAFKTDTQAGYKDAKNNEVVLFQGDQIVRLSGVTVKSGYPRRISLSYIGVPTKFRDNLDAATMRAGFLYLIKGGQYVKLKNDTVYAGYPKALSNFPK